MSIDIVLFKVNSNSFLATFLDLDHSFSLVRSNKLMEKDKLIHLMDEYFMSNPLFCRQGQNDNF